MNNDYKALINIVRVGTVSSVDVDNRTARVAFADKQDTDGKPLISAPLKVLQNQPLITIEKWDCESAAEYKWEYETQYNSIDRVLELGESYVENKYNERADIIINRKRIGNEDGGVISGRQTVTVYPWLPYVGQLVVCLYLPNGESDGFVIGGI